MGPFRKEDVVGKTVIETSGRVVGKVRDVLFDLNGTITFVVGGADGKDSQIPVARVTGISEHVIVRGDQPAGPGASGPGVSCKFCGSAMKASERWCPVCGKSQT